MSKSKLSIIIFALVMLIPVQGFSATHYGVTNLYISSTTPAPGETIQMEFDINIGGYYDGPPAWEIWLGGSIDTRDGVLLGSYEFTYAEWGGGDATLHVETDITIPGDAEVGPDIIKLFTRATISWTNAPTVRLNIIDIEIISPVQTVDIDIKPCVYPNYIVLNPWSLVPVAILSDEDFDATAVDPATVDLAGAGVAYLGCLDLFVAIEMDVNCDGLTDLVCGIEVGDIDPDQVVDGYAYLVGSTYDGLDIEGSDEVILKVPRWWRW